MCRWHAAVVAAMLAISACAPKAPPATVAAPRHAEYVFPAVPAGAAPEAADCHALLDPLLVSARAPRVPAASLRARRAG